MLAGSYQDDTAQSSCKPCPEINGKPGTTVTTGSISPQDCKETCSAGHFYSLADIRCKPCGYSFFQSFPGQFQCSSCPPFMTTASDVSVNRSACLLDCADGEETSGGICQRCGRGTYRERGQGPACFPCPVGFSTGRNGSVTVLECNVPVCGPGSFFDQSSNTCVICPFGFYQPLAEQSSCLQCPEDMTTIKYGATSLDR